MNVLKKWPYIFITFSLLLFATIFVVNRGIPIYGGQLSINFYDCRTTLLRYNKQKKEIGFTSKDGNIEKISINKHQYSLKQLKKNQPKRYKRIINSVKEFNFAYRYFVAFLAFILAVIIVFLIPEKFDRNMIITNLICTIASIFVTISRFTNPSLKNDYILSIVVIFYSTAQMAIKLRTSWLQ